MNRDLLTGIIVVVMIVLAWVAWTTWAERDTNAYCASQGKVCPKL